MASMINIGIFNTTRYWQKYVFSNPPKGFSYKRAIDIPFHLLGTKNQFLLNTKWPIPFQPFDLFHTYNSIIPINKPWIVEVESKIPRYGKFADGDFLFNLGKGRLHSDSCKKIIFTSKSTAQINQPHFEKWGIPTEKCEVVYRAVQIYPSLLKGDESTFNILFAGNGFYRKGGLELLKSFSKVKHSDIQLTIISNFEIDWAVIPTKEDQEWVKQTIREDKRISVYTGLPHDKVIEIMRRSHVFVATTFADPFNNTILEAMSCGIPIISSNIRSIPEFVENNKNGFTIAPDNKEEIIEFIVEKLNILYDNNKLRNKMAENARSTVRRKFTLEQRNKALSKIYKEALEQ